MTHGGRGLSKEFIDDLKCGILKSIYEQTRKDNTLFIGIRTDYINLYYRGCSLIRIERRKKISSPSYTAFTAQAYLRQPSHLPKVLTSTADASAWVNEFPSLKNSIDLHGPSRERDMQQLIARENNEGNSDYFVVDIEFTKSGDKNGRFDMVGVQWKSSAHDRKNTKDKRLVFLELKQGDNALQGSSGVVDHAVKVNRFISSGTNLAQIKAEMLQVFNQQVELGTLTTSKKLESFGAVPPLFVFLIGEHKPTSSVLLREFQSIRKMQRENQLELDIRVARSSLIGYALYERNLLTLDDALSLLENNIPQSDT